MTAPATIKDHAGPVALVLLVIVTAWYLGAIALNADQVTARLNGTGANWTWQDLTAAAWAMDRPVLPAPHQVAANWWQSTFATEPDSPRSLVFHAGVTLSATLLGFLMGMVLGIAIAIGVVYSRVLDRSLLPWIIASQTIPILAIAPMVVVVLGSLGYPPLASKAVISMYLCFFPVAIGMVKGLRSPDPLALDLMRTYSANGWQVLLKLRLPAALPFLFASAKVAIATSLVGAIVGELPTGAQAGLGARLLSGSYFGQTIQIWSALVMAALLGVLLVAAVAVVEKLTGRAMGGTGVTAQFVVAIGVLAALWWALRWLASLPPTHGRQWLAPAVFGLAVLGLWEWAVHAFDVPKVLLPAPSAVGLALVARWPVLWPDFVQTAWAVVAGFAIGNGAGFAVAVLADRFGVLKRGLLPLANLAGAVPIVGIAPIFVMWFGFDWHSKAAVAAVVTFFPMLVNAVAGLAAVDAMHRDLMRTYAAGHTATLAKLRLPGALPFLFNALKINSTLALIAAIVAEFFGSPIVGLGFRISAEVARMNVDVVWAAITLAALAGSAFYGVMALMERAFTFWHPSYRD